MHSELSDKEIAIAARAARRQQVWRYGRWVQLLAALVFVGIGFRFGGFWTDPTLVGGVIHPYFLLVFGLVGAGEALGNIAGKERSLLLKLLHPPVQSAI